MEDTTTEQPPDDDTIWVEAKEVRAWLKTRNVGTIGTRGHLSQEAIDRFNRAHKRRQFSNKNPMSQRRVTR